MSDVVPTFCRICESLCGLEVEVADDRVAAVRPDRAHVATAGFACVKGLEQHTLYDSPDRLTTPLKRVGERFEPISWRQALREIGAAVKRQRRVHPNRVAMYVGTAAGFSFLHPIFAQGFMQGVGSTSLYATATQDCANKFAVARHIYGFPFLQPFPDLERTELLVIVGANPVVSKWSFGQVTNPAERLRQLRARGARVVVVDPRRTETAVAAGEHLFIRPGSDVFFYLAFLHEVLHRDGVDRARVDAFTRGLDALAPLTAAWTPERCAEATGVPADALRELVGAYLAADGAALYSSTGVNMGGSGALAFWLQEVINAITGNLDRPGGTLVGQGLVDFPGFSHKRGVLMRDARSRVGGLPVVNDALAGGVLADEILTPGDEQVRALFVTGGNPLLTMPNSARLADALRSLDLLVVVDLFLTETASLADYVLPAVSPLQRPDLPFVFPAFLGMQSAPYVQATRAVVPPTGEQRDEASIYLDLCRASGVGLFGSRLAQLALGALASLRSLFSRGPRRLPQTLLMSLFLRAARQGSFRRLLRRAPHGRTLPGERAGTFLGARVLTPDGKVDLAPAALLAEAADLERRFAAATAPPPPGTFSLITRRHLMTHNSWTHNVPRFVTGKRATNYLYVHPDDAAGLGLASGDLADVRSATGAVRLPVALLDTLMPGVVALPHGWGHQGARGLTVARATRGVNVNLLAADGPDALEPVSGMARLTGIPVTVTPAAGPADPTSWSGMPPGPDALRKT